MSSERGDTKTTWDGEMWKSIEGERGRPHGNNRSHAPSVLFAQDTGSSSYSTEEERERANSSVIGFHPTNDEEERGGLRIIEDSDRQLIVSARDGLELPSLPRGVHPTGEEERGLRIEDSDRELFAPDRGPRVAEAADGLLVSSYRSFKGTRSNSNRHSLWKFEEYELPQSTYTLLITSDLFAKPYMVGNLAIPKFSKPYIVGILATALSVTALGIVLYNVIQSGSEVSPLGLPAGVKVEVIMAQYLGVIIGVLMEEEIPLGLEIIGKCVEQGMLGRSPFDKRKVYFSSILRMAVGYMYLTCLFLTVIQNSNVLDIFFDVLALEFVEKLDDALYLLLKRGFFGKTLRIATYTTHNYQSPGDDATHKFSKRMKVFIRTVYFVNMLAMVTGVTYIVVQQYNGVYRCGSISIAIADDVWEEAWVKLDGGGYEKRLLIYSHFNGIYKENRTRAHDNRPRYTEQNKEGHTGEAYEHTIGAEIIYCKELGSWVFRHENIRTSNPFLEGEDENECSWLLRSPQSDSFDVIEVAKEGSWDVWTGQIGPESSISITCNECYNDAGCNNHGECVDQKCQCHEEDFFGIHCEFERPCSVIRSAKDENITLNLLYDTEDHEDHFVEVYGHPKYEVNMQGIPTGLMKMGTPYDDNFADDDFFEIHNELESFQELLMNYTFSLRYTGRRWYGQIVPPGLSAENFNEKEYHAFWNNAFSGLGVDDNATVIISAPTTDASPVGVDFYEMRRRNKHFETGIKNYNYGPFGVLIKMVGSEGAGYFHCNRDE